METKGKEKMIEDETVADKEVWDNIKFTDEQINKLKEKYGLGHMKIIDEQINEFLDDMFNQKKKELLLIKVIVKLMRVNTKDDAFSVSDSEDDESEADDDTDVMWVVPYKSHASTSKVSKFKEQKGLLDLLWDVPAAKTVQWGVPAVKRVQWDVQAQNRRCSYGSWHVTWKGVRQMVSTG
ncbi:hypothetical protein Tco_0188712 [Tanacetum coccineum]